MPTLPVGARCDRKFILDNVQMFAAGLAECGTGRNRWRDDTRMAPMKWFLSLLTAALLTSPAVSQQPQIGQRIRLQPAGEQGWLDGVFLGAWADSLLVQRASGGQLDTLAVGSVRRVQTVQGSHWGTGLLVGAAAGAVIGVVGILTSCAEEDVGCANTNPGAAVYGLGGAVLGGILGLAIGALIPNWEDADPALLVPVAGVEMGLYLAIR